MSENEKYETSNEIIKIMNDPQPFPRKVPDYMRGKGGLWYHTLIQRLVVVILSE